MPSLVQLYSRHLCLIGGGLICYGYMCIVYISAITCAKFGVVVFKASLLDLGGQSVMGKCALFYIYICHYMCQVWCSSIHGIYA